MTKQVAQSKATCKEKDTQIKGLEEKLAKKDQEIVDLGKEIGPTIAEVESLRQKLEEARSQGASAEARAKEKEDELNARLNSLEQTKVVLETDL